MELEKIKGSIVGIISNEKPDFEKYNNQKVNEILTGQIDKSLKMVGLDAKIKEKNFQDLSSCEKNKIILASKLQDKTIILYDFSKGMIKKDLDYFKRLFKKLITYQKRIILYSNDLELFLNCVDNICLINNDKVIYETTDIFDPTIYLETNKPKIVEFIYKCEDLGIKLNEYRDINELIKAIFRIKS